MKKNNDFKPWVILIVCAGISAASVGISINSSGVFYTPVSDGLGILRGTFAMHMTIFTFTGAFIVLFMPKIMDKFSYKFILYVTIGVSVITTALMGINKSVIGFYVLGAIRGVTTSFYSIYPTTIIINGWFKKNNGLATSIALGFSGLIGAIFSPIFTNMIKSLGWQTTYFIKSGIILFFCLPALIYPFKLTAKEEGRLPYGYDEELDIKPNGYRNNKEFNLINLGFILLLIFGSIYTIITGMIQHFPGFAVNIGHSINVGATLLSASMMGNVIFKIVMGVISDKVGVIKSTLTMMIINIIGMTLMVIAQNSIILIIGAFLFGGCYSVGAVGLPLLTRYLFGIENYSKVFPIISFVAGVGAALSLSLIGYIYDFTGSYNYSFILGFLINVICLSLISIIVYNKGKQTTISNDIQEDSLIKKII